MREPLAVLLWAVSAVAWAVETPAPNAPHEPTAPTNPVSPDSKAPPAGEVKSNTPTPAATPTAPPVDVASTTDKKASQAATLRKRRAVPVGPTTFQQALHHPAHGAAGGALAHENTEPQAHEAQELLTRLEDARAALTAEGDRVEKLIKELHDKEHACKGTTVPQEPAGADAKEKSETAPTVPKTPAVVTTPVAAAAPTTPTATTPAAKPGLDIVTLGKSLKAMKPQKAAQVVERLDRHTAARILKGMGAQKAGAVMQAMPPNAAAEVAEAMLQLRDGA